MFGKFSKKNKEVEKTNEETGIKLSDIDINVPVKVKKKKAQLEEFDEDVDYDDKDTYDEEDNYNVDEVDPEYDPEFDGYDDMYNGDDSNSSDIQKQNGIDKWMKIVKIIVPIAIVLGIIWGVYALKSSQKEAEKRMQGNQPQVEQKQEEKPKEENNEKPKEEVKKEKPKEEDTEKQAKADLEKSDVPLPEKETKTVTDELTKQFNAVAEKNGDFKPGSIKDVLTVTKRGSVASLNNMIVLGYKIDKIKVYDSNTDKVYQFTMVLKAKDQPDITWNGNYFVETGGVELKNYYGDAPVITGRGQQVDEEKRTKV
jgi:hypothetical protein